MKLILHPTDSAFKENLLYLREIGRCYEIFLNVVRNGKGNDARAARVIETGFGGEIGFGYTVRHGEIRCLLDEISHVEVYFSRKER